MNVPTADARDSLAERFEGERGRLRAIAYRMLGSMTEADDAVQETWVRLDRAALERTASDRGAAHGTADRTAERRAFDRAGFNATDDLRGWLTVVLGRICLDALRVRRRRREDYAGTWLPEPLVSPIADDDPERDAVMADSVGIALLVVLETLTPAERLAFVLHDVFAQPFDEIARVLGRSPAAARQLASRGRRRIQAAAPRPDADLHVQRQVVDAFLAAARGGDFEGLLQVLDPDVVLRTDGGGSGPLARPPVRGADAVARQLTARGARFAPFARPVLVNGSVGVVVRPPDQAPIVVGFTVSGGRIAAIDLVGDPRKLARVAIAGE